MWRVWLFRFLIPDLISAVLGNRTTHARSYDTGNQISFCMNAIVNDIILSKPMYSVVRIAEGILTRLAGKSTDRQLLTFRFDCWNKKWKVAHSKSTFVPQIFLNPHFMLTLSISSIVKC